MSDVGESLPEFADNPSAWKSLHDWLRDVPMPPGRDGVEPPWSLLGAIVSVRSGYQLGLETLAMAADVQAERDKNALLETQFADAQLSAKGYRAIAYNAAVLAAQAVHQIRLAAADRPGARKRSARQLNRMAVDSLQSIDQTTAVLLGPISEVEGQDLVAAAKLMLQKTEARLLKNAEADAESEVADVEAKS